MKVITVKILIIGLLVVGMPIVGFGVYTLWQIHQRFILNPKDLHMDYINDEKSGNVYIFSGKKQEVEQGMKAFQEGQKRIDPAIQIIRSADDYYQAGEYDKAEAEAKRALQEAKERPVVLLAHCILLDVYEKTHKYDLAIQEVDWQLANVPAHAKPELLEKKSQLEQLLATQKQVQ